MKNSQLIFSTSSYTNSNLDKVLTIGEGWKPKVCWALEIFIGPQDTLG